MIGRLKDLTFNRGGGQTLTIAVDGDCRQMFDRLKDSVCRIEINAYKERRSLSANAYFHVLVNAIAKAVGASDGEIKRRLVLDYGTVMRNADGTVAGFEAPANVELLGAFPDAYAKWFDTRIVGKTKFDCYILYKPTHLMDTAEMSHLIDKTISEAKALGIETMTPAELARLNGYERRK